MNIIEVYTQFEMKMFTAASLGSKCLIDWFQRVKKKKKSIVFSVPARIDNYSMKEWEKQISIQSIVFVLRKDFLPTDLCYASCLIL